MSEIIKRFKALTAKKERYYRQLQTTYDMIPKLPVNVEVFIARCDNLDATYDLFSSVINELEDLSYEDETLQIDGPKVMGSYDTLHFSVVAAKRKYAPPIPPPINVPGVPHGGKITLPKLNMQKFNGCIEQFPTFNALFNSNVHSALDLNNAQKFSYLLSLLEGDALRLINTVQFDPENYTAAYNLLQTTYSQPRILANYYVKNILNIKPSKVGSIDSLKEMIDRFDTSVTALKVLGIPNLGDFLLLSLGLRLVDCDLRAKFEQKHLGTDFPEYKDFITFCRNYCLVGKLADSSFSNSSSSRSSLGQVVSRNKALVAMDTTNSVKNSLVCPCGEGSSHYKISNCPKFRNADVASRISIVKQFRLCWACLSRAHSVCDCKSSNCCEICRSKKHHSMLHRSYPASVASPTSNTPQASSSSTSNNVTVDNAGESSGVVLSSCSAPNNSKNCLLGTARIRVQGTHGKWYSCRAVCDSGSTVNFITLALANQLGLRRKKCSQQITGIGHTTSISVSGMIETQIVPHFSSEPSLHLSLVVVPKITSDLPNSAVSGCFSQQFNTLQLADPQYDRPSPVDILLGVQAFLDLVPSNAAHIKGEPTAMYTSFGWIILGSLPDNAPPSDNCALLACSTECQELTLNNLVQSFWEREEISVPPSSSPEDLFCEDYFQKTVSRDESGRYIVRLPFKEAVFPMLGSTRQRALDRFLKLEKRFRANPNFETLYKNNIQDYINQGHMVPAVEPSSYIMTHHGVLKVSGEGEEKLRVVFSPAERDSSGLSLNDRLLVGPKLQNDIGQVVTRFRLHKVALCCDIKQMYREIGIHHEDSRYQHLFFRFSEHESVKEWELVRVTFGINCAPYLALRTLRQLVADEGSPYPRAAEVILHESYVDDMLTGASSAEEAIAVRTELIALLKKGGFTLDKWASSDPNVVLQSELGHREMGSDQSSSLKVLGLWWDPVQDCFRYRCDSSNTPCTKRGLLSRVARMYDFNGYLGPVTFKMKYLIQQLWLCNLDWDEQLPTEFRTQWMRILEELPLIESVTIPRCIMDPSRVKVQLIGFADASASGMAAVLYLRVDSNIGVSCHIIKSKTRVSPLKAWTINRLELGAAVLLSRVVQSSLPLAPHLTPSEVICFTDSSCVLSWINTPPYRLKTFVSNRVVQISENCPQATWRHVPGLDNPADSASRGLLPSEFLKDQLWWHGPSFLQTPIESWPVSMPLGVSSSDGELKNVQPALLTQINPNPFIRMLNNCSSLIKAIRCCVLVIRFLYNLLMKVHGQPRTSWLLGPISSSEYLEARLFLVMSTQFSHFSSDIRSLKLGKPPSKTLVALSPFLDSLGYLRVGGRLARAPLPFQRKHPLLIPRNSRLACLICDHYHLYSGHGGPRLVQSLICREYWIPSIRSILRSRIFQCLTCYRFQVKPIQPKMSDLPASRVNPGRAFLETGVDVAGPYDIKSSTLRSARIQKAYFAIFICMATKAVHIEVLLSLSTEAFLACLDRFIARRGLPFRILSDQGRNFLGAAREITEITSFLKNSGSDVQSYLLRREIEWIFHPPYSPNWGGLWERGVGSVKFHLKRVIGSQKLTLEEFNTILIRIEAILNSRPLTDLSPSTQDNCDVLTPGHFLVQAPLLARPEVDISTIPSNRLSRWQLLRQLTQSFWNRWLKEYLHTQLQRPKWTQSTPTPNIGDLVLYSPTGFPKCPTSEWPLGRVAQLMPGSDGEVRVLRIQTSTGSLVRPATKVAIIPTDC